MRCAPSTACCETILQQHAIGKIGEGVVIGQMREALFRAPPLAPHPGVVQLPVDRRDEPLHLTLRDVVVRTRLDGRDHRVFADACPRRR